MRKSAPHQAPAAPLNILPPKASNQSKPPALLGRIGAQRGVAAAAGRSAAISVPRDASRKLVAANLAPAKLIVLALEPDKPATRSIDGFPSTQRSVLHGWRSTVESSITLALRPSGNQSAVRSEPVWRHQDRKPWQLAAANSPTSADLGSHAAREAPREP